MLTDDPAKKARKGVRSRAVGASRKHWSDSQKIEAVTTYLALGEVRLTASVLKIPEITLHSWKSKDWWKEIESELRHQENLQLSVRLQKIMSKSLDVVEDRLANGNFIYDQKTGELVRKPVDVKDAHKIGMEMIDKREVLINKQPAQLSAEALDDKLEKLAAKFAEIAQAARAPVLVTDVIFEDASHEEADEDDIDPYEDYDENDLDDIPEEDEDDAIYEESEREERSGLQEGK